MKQVQLTVEDIRSRFQMKFKGAEGNVYAAPGRINLIGEHTDYNGGRYQGAKVPGPSAPHFKTFATWGLAPELHRVFSGGRAVAGLCRRAGACRYPDSSGSSDSRRNRPSSSIPDGGRARSGAPIRP